MTKPGKKSGGELSQAAVEPQQPSRPLRQQQEAAVAGSAVGLLEALPEPVPERKVLRSDPSAPAHRLLPRRRQQSFSTLTSSW